MAIFVVDYLWSDVVGSAAHSAPPLTLVLDLSGEAEVSDLDLHLVGEEQVA